VNPERHTLDPATTTSTADEAPQTQTLEERTPPTTSLAVEPAPEREPRETPAAAVEPMSSADALPTDPPADPRTGWGTRGLRMRTVVLGLVLLAVSATSLLRVLTDVRIDDSLVVLILLVVAGALLLGGGVASAAREARAGRGRR
jgi:hypothetical protein